MKVPRNLEELLKRSNGLNGVKFSLYCVRKIAKFLKTCLFVCQTSFEILCLEFYFHFVIKN